MEKARQNAEYSQKLLNGEINPSHNSNIDLHNKIEAEKEENARLHREISEVCMIKQDREYELAKAVNISGDTKNHQLTINQQIYDAKNRID